MIEANRQVATWCTAVHAIVPMQRRLVSFGFHVVPGERTSSNLTFSKGAYARLHVRGTV